MNTCAGRWMPSLHSGLQCPQSQLCIDLRGNSIANYFPAERIQNRRQEDETGDNPDVDNVSNPDPIWHSRDGITVQVRKHRRILLCLASAHETSRWLDVQIMFTHEARNVFVIDDITACTQFQRDAPVAIAGEFILDIADQRHQFAIIQPDQYGP